MVLNGIFVICHQQWNMIFHLDAQIYLGSFKAQLIERDTIFVQSLAYYVLEESLKN